MRACTCCRLLYPRESFGVSKSGRAYRSCPECRGKDGDQIVKKRQCHGAPGHVCKKMITDYRCPDCWARVRGGARAEDGGTGAEKERPGDQGA